MTKVSFSKKLVAAALLLFSTASWASADEMQWDLKNKSAMHCKLVDGMTLKRGLDFVETKKLVCYRKGEMVPSVTSMVSCGPEGSVTRFGKRVKVTCHTQWLATK